MVLHLQSLIAFHFFLVPGLGLHVDSLVPALPILVQHSPTTPQKYCQALPSLWVSPLHQTGRRSSLASWVLLGPSASSPPCLCHCPFPLLIPTVPACHLSLLHHAQAQLVARPHSQSWPASSSAPSFSTFPLSSSCRKEALPVRSPVEDLHPHFDVSSSSSVLAQPTIWALSWGLLLQIFACGSSW